MARNRWHTKRPTQAEAQRRREYNSREYRRAGQACARQVATGTARCWRPTCQRPIPAGSQRGRDWVVGHDDHNRNIIRGVECTNCNTRAACQAGARTANAKRHRPRPHAL